MKPEVKETGRDAWIEMGEYTGSRYELEGYFRIVEIAGLPGKFIALGDTPLPEVKEDE